MRCPTLRELPSPPAGKTGWPWTEESTPAPDVTPSGDPWPRISIVTPSYNQGAFLEETIRSVLLQGYPNLEYLVIDGGSTDGSVDIMRKYAPSIASSISEPDSGQSEAINKGFRQATGEIVAWMNSDDYLWPGVLERAAEIWRRSDPARFWVVFAIEHHDEESGRRWVTPQQQANALDDWLVGKVQVNQQGSFWSRSITEAVGLLDEDLHLGMDTEYFMRMVANGYRMERINEVVGGTFRIHDASKTGNYHGEIVDRDQAFLYDWTLARLRHLPATHVRYRELKTEFQRTLSYCELRFAQNRKLSRHVRARHLLKAARLAPSSIFGKAFLGSARRLLTV